MNPRELEEKLEKDNLTLKEHILKLQQTIKQIKSEIMTGDSREEVLPTNKKQADSSDIRNKTNYKDKKFIPENIIQHDKDEDRDDNNLKFSFNVRDEKVSEKRKNSQEKIKEEKNKTNTNNIYKDNFTKIRKEKEILEKTEKLKKESNLGKKYFDANKEEILKFQKNLRNNNYLNVNEQKSRKEKDDELNERDEGEGENDQSNQSKQILIILTHRSLLTLE
jgi:hypothetical protein